jgi:hypothetical protein
MKRSFHIVVVALFVILALGSIAESVTAKEQGPFAEFRLTAGDAGLAAEYGRSVAIDGNFVAIGAGNATVENATGQEVNGGAVYLYKRQGMTYVLEAKLFAPDATSGAEFGRTVAIKGNTVCVGARFAQFGDLEHAGAVYIYKKFRGSWYLEDKIVSPAPADEDNFGRALAIQGDLLVVTARKSSNEEGAAYLFVYKDGSWVYREELTASDPVKKAYFGQSVDLQGDIMAIGARNANPNGAGAVYLFRQSGNEWSEFAKIAPENGKKDDHFGFTVAISGDTIAVGARRADLSSNMKDAGAAYIYFVNEDSIEFITRLTASDANEGDEFGQSVAIAGDVIAVGAWKDDENYNETGSIYLFHKAGNRWIEAGKIIATDGKEGDEFGYSLAAFGNLMVTGAHFAGESGAAYVLPVKV